MARHQEDKKNSIMGETRRKLIEAAAQEFSVQGFNKANVNLIAEQAGFSIGTLYNYFPTKRELMFAFITDASDQHVQFIQEKVLQVELPAHRLEVFFEAGFAFIEQHITLAKAIFNTLNGPDEEFKLKLFQAYQPLFQLLGKQIVGEGIAQEVFRPVDPMNTANLIMLVYLGVGSQFNREGKLWVQAEQVSEFILNSLLKR